MLRRLPHPTFVNLRSILSLLPLVVMTVAGAVSAHLHIVLPAGSNWG